jgi:hypothetical protein
LSGSYTLSASNALNSIIASYANIMPYSSSVKTYNTSSALFTGSFYLRTSGSISNMTSSLFVYTGLKWVSCSLSS